MRKQKTIKWIAAVTVLFALCCRQGVTPGFTLLDPLECGVGFSNNLIESDSFNIIQYLYFYNGAGTGIGDFDNDGLEDLVFASNQGHPELYKNTSKEGVIRFEDVSKTSGLAAIKGWNTGVSIADVNGDGWLDIYICQLGSYKNQRGKNRMLINRTAERGVMYFEDHGDQMGLDFEGFSTQAAFFDFDRDGDLDVYLLNHSVHEPGNYGNASLRNEADPSSGDRLLMNESGRFSDITQKAGIYSSKIGYGLGIGISDVNGDRWPDIYVGNDFHENDYLFINRQDGTFDEVIRSATGHTSQFSMGIDLADLNNDLRTDVISLDMMPPDEYTRKTSVGGDRYEIAEFKHSFGYHHQLPRNHVQINVGNEDDDPRFVDLAPFTGLESTDWSWTVLAGDYDNDGLKDLFVSNGIPRRPNDLDYLNFIANPLVQRKASDLEIASRMPSGEVANYLFAQEANLKFVDKSDVWGLDMPTVSTGAAQGDLDNDGDLDLVINNINAQATVFENKTTSQTPTNHLRVRLKGDGLNTWGVGSKVTVYAEKTVQVVEQYPVRGFMSSSSPIVHFGLGSIQTIDSLVVEWPRGSKSTIYRPGINTILVAYESQAEIETHEIPAAASTMLIMESEDLYYHLEDPYNDLEREKLLPWVLSQEGPGLATADVNGDGLDDFFVGGAYGTTGGLYIQTAEGEFVVMEEEFWENEAAYEDVAAVFADFDGDADMDLVVGSGGNHLPGESPLYLDRMYRNDGGGKFTKVARALPFLTYNTACVKAEDFDGDGDVDLFIGQRNNEYLGDRTTGRLLINDGAGLFESSIALPGLGMVTDAGWGDFNGDGRPDLIVVGEWMPLTCFINEDRGFVKKEIVGTSGLWNSVMTDDVNGDGKMDFIAGNFGLNHNLAPHRQQLNLYVKDFDDNGSADPIMTYWNDSEYTVMSRDELAGQINKIKKRYTKYREFARQEFSQLFSKSELNGAETYEVELFESVWMEGDGNGNFLVRALPRELQAAPIGAITSLEIAPGEKAYIFAGNRAGVMPRIGRQMGSYGHLAFYRSESWVMVQPAASGLFLKGQINGLISFRGGSPNSIYLVAGTNNGPLQTYKANRVERLAQ